MVKLSRLADRFQRWNAKQRPSAEKRAEKASGVLLLSSGGLGDTILFSHVIEAFAGYADAGEPVTVLLRKDGAKTAFLFPASIKTFVVDLTRFRKNISYRLDVSNALYAANYRAVISTDYLRHPDLDEVLMLAAQAPETIAMAARPWAKYQAQLDKNAQSLTRTFDSGPALQDKMLRWFRFASWLTKKPVKPQLKQIAKRLNPTPAENTSPLVLVQPFSAVTAKQCPPAVYEALFDALPPDTQIRITGAPGEMEANPAYKGLLERPNVAYEDAGFSDLVPLLQAARLVVSVDTAVMHLSVAVGAPTLCLASAGYVGEIVPYADEFAQDNVDFYYKSMSCEGCLGSCIHPLQDDAYLCVAGLETDQVIARAMKLFAGASNTQ